MALGLARDRAVDVIWTWAALEDMPSAQTFRSTSSGRLGRCYRRLSIWKDVHSRNYVECIPGTRHLQ